MVRCTTGPRRARVPALIALAGLATAGLAPSVSHAQPAADIDRARDLYQSAEAAMKDDRFADAIRDYGASYELSKDPALFFKLGRAHERSGHCEAALIYYARYLREGKPSAPFVATTQDRIAACGGDPAHQGTGEATPPTEPRDLPERPILPAIPPAPAPPNGERPAAAAPDSPRMKLVPNTRHKIAWVLTGGGVALLALGGVLAYATNASENDVRDLYVGFGGRTATFDAATRQRYDELIDEGRRYERLSWTAFGLAGAAAVGAVTLFVLGRETPQHAVVPVLTTSTAGVALTF